MAYDVLSVLQSLVTKTTDFNSDGLDLKTGTPKRGMVARLIVPSYISTATAGSTFVFKIQESNDNTTFNDLVTFETLTGGTAAGTTEMFRRFATRKRYVRLAMDIGVTSGTPSIAYSGELGLAEP